MKILFYAQFFLILPIVVLAEESNSNNPVIAESINQPVRITITGSLSPEGMERVGKPVSVLGEEELRKNEGSSIGEALSNEPGVSSSYFGPVASRPIIRGQGKERVRILENGLEVGDVSATSDDHAVTMDTLTTERIDILRGASTLLYGSQAIGGVVNVIDGSIKEEDIGKELTGKIDLKQGNAGNGETGGGAVLEGQAGKINWHISGYDRTTDDLKIPGFAESSQLRELEEAEHEHSEDESPDHENDQAEEKGRLENTDSSSSGVKAGLSHVWDKGYVGVALRHTDSNYGVPGGHVHHDEEEVDPLVEMAEEEDVRIDLEQTKIESRGAVFLEDPTFKSLQFGTTYSDYRHEELEGEDVGTRYDRKAFETRLLLTHQHDEYLEGGWGFQFNHDDLKTKGAEAFVPSTETVTPALFFVEDFSLADNLIWQFGGRYEHASLNPVMDLPKRDFDLLSSSTGIIYFTNQKEYSAAVNLSYSERAPNATELYADGAHLATQTYEIGDENISQERSVGTELILRKLTGSTRGSFTMFHQKYFDYLNLAPNGDVRDDFSVFEYNQIGARFWGLESEIEQDIFSMGLSSLSAYGGLDYVRARNTTNSDDLPRITPLRGKTGLKYQYDRLDTYIEGIFVATQDDTAEFELPTDSYNLLNMGATYSIFSDADSSIEVYLKGTNLTNEEARVHNSFLKDQAPLRGRAFFVGLTTYF